MTNAELERALRIYNRRQPFRPFLLEFTSGEQIRIDHREAIALFTDLWYYLGSNRVESLFSGSSVCRLLDTPPA